MTSNKLKNLINLKSFKIIIGIFIISKLVIFKYFFQIHSDFASYWQLSNLELLKEDLLNTIKYLHMQQPLWNYFVGLVLKASNGDLIFASRIILIVHWFFSIIILYIIKFYSDEFKLGLLSRNIVCLIFIFHPSIIFYENLPYYPHLVVTLFSIGSFFLYKFFKEEKIIFEIYFYIILIILIYLISAFVPLLIIAFFIIFRIIDWKRNKYLNLGKNIKILIPILVIAFLPYLKNYFVFGVFSKGTWSGLQLSVTTTHIPNNKYFVLCGLGRTFGGSEDQLNKSINEYFLKYKKNKNKLNHASIVGNKSSRNNIGMITRSQWCLGKSLELINQNKFLWIKGRIIEFLVPHTQLAIDYDIIEHPLGYEKVKEEKLKLYEITKVKKLKQLLVFTFMITIYIFFIVKILNNKNKNNLRLFYLTLFLLYGYILTISSLFGFQEGQRFMHYGIIIQFLFFIELLKSKFKN